MTDKRQIVAHTGTSECPNCGYGSVVISTTYDPDTRIRRRRRACTKCSHRWFTLELAEDSSIISTVLQLARNGITTTPPKGTATMSKAEAIAFIDQHKNALINPVDMLHWTWLLVIINNIPDETWEAANLTSPEDKNGRN